ncbi:MAG: ferredoxin--NADP reductase [Spirochaeta sp.]
MQNPAIVQKKATTFAVHHVQHLSPTAFVVRFDRAGMQFKPGQYITAGIANDLHVREYSIYSSPQDDFLEILVKTVENGLVSRKLQGLKPGDALQVEGPFGYFLLEDQNTPVLMIATGTGISPFHSMIQDNPALPYTLLHGVRTESENYAWDLYDPDRFVRCISQPVEKQIESPQHFTGRVTEYLRRNPVMDPATRCYLCGNCDMIYEVFDILQEHGIPSHQLFAEVYF